MEVAVAVVLAIIGGLWALSRSDIDAYRRLAKAYVEPAALVCAVGTGIMVGACLAVWKVGSGQMLLIGIGAMVAPIVLHHLIRFFDWLHGEKPK